MAVDSAALTARSSTNTLNNGANWIFKGCSQGGPSGTVGSPAIY